MQTIENNLKWIEEVWAKLEKKTRTVAIRSKDKLPYTTFGGVHDDKSQNECNWWTNGFWPGLMWLMYNGTKDETYKATAEIAEKLLDNALMNYDGLDHDVGFMWHISSVVNYRLFGNKDSRTRGLFAANMLSGRFNLQGSFIRAWNEDKAGWTIIDTMMNLPLLYWASKEVNDERFTHIAKAHANKTMMDHIRPDGSVVHIVSHDTGNGEVIETFGGQGFSVGSSWSRGQAWAIYGFVLSYIHTKDQRYLDTAKKVAHYFISCVCDDFLPMCDFRSPAEPLLYDSTAGVCAACGLIEISKCVSEHESKIYLNAAIKLLKAIEENFCNWEENEDSVLQMGTEAYYCDDTKKHIPIIYGDYFFAEAIYKLKGYEMLFW